MRERSWRELLIRALNALDLTLRARWTASKRLQKRARYRAARIERLEHRIVPAVTATVAGESVTFSGGKNDDLYLKVVGGDLEYSSVNSNFMPVESGFLVTESSTISASIGGTLYLVGMDQGGGTYSNTDSGKIEVIGNVTTLGGALTLTGTSIVVDNAPVLGTSGSLTGSSGQSFQVASDDTTKNTVTLKANSGSTALSEGTSLKYLGSSGSGSNSLQNGVSYLVHIIDKSNPQSPTVQLYLPGITVSTSTTTGTAGAITFNAPSITVGAFDKIQATGSGGDGAITFTATDTKIGEFGLTLVNQIADTFDHSFNTSISIGSDAVVNGGDVNLTATAGDVSVFASANSASDLAINLLASPLANYLNQWLGLPISVLIANSTAKAELGEYAQIQSSGGVTISTTATSNATGEATFWYNFLVGASFSFAEATTDAESLIDQNASINATGSSGVSVTASTTSTTSGTSLVTQNTSSSNAPEDPNHFQLSGGYNDLTTTTYATLGRGAKIDSPQGPVNFSATANDTNSLNVQTSSYKDGFVGLSGGGHR